MVPAIKISEKTTLYELEQQFGLRMSTDRQFFWEWQQELPALTALDQQLLSRIKANYDNLIKRATLSENLVKMAILSPLLDLAGFYSANCQIRDEAPVRLSGKDEGKLYRGKIDILVAQNRLWILVIESKNSGFSLNKALPQALAYMLGSPNRAQPTFGLITNGSEFRFLKLAHPTPPLYALSELFSILTPDNDLPHVLRIFKQIRQLIQD